MGEIIRVRGGHKLYGQVKVGGSKNSALACLAAACLVTDGQPVTLENVPQISDIYIMIDIIKSLGKTVEFNDGILTIAGSFTSCTVPADVTDKLRGAMYFIGVLAATVGELHVGFPGGDKIGDRPIDIHINALKKLGVECEQDGNMVNGFVNDHIEGNQIYLRYPSVGATCNVMMAAARANGKTIITNVAKEPEIVDVSNLLNKMGVKVTGAGTDRITVIGTDNIHGAVIHDVITDRIEVGVLAVATAMCGGEVCITNAIPYHNYPLISLLNDNGVRVTEVDNGILVTSDGKINALDAEMMPFPGIATDLQSAVATMCTICEGKSTIVDLVFQNRFQYVPELIKMGADLERNGNTLIINGGKKLVGTRVAGTDIRAVSALICAGLVADGETVIEGVLHLKRGYPELDQKLRSLGADVWVVEEEICDEDSCEVE